MAEPGWSLNDKRTSRTASGLFLPKTTAVGEKNNVLASQLNREKVSGMRRTGANLQMAMPKQRVPMGSLMDKGIPFDTSDPKELSEARKLSRLYYRTHDLVPLLIDIYAKFPVIGLEFESKDSLIENFYSEMFLNDLNYEEFLPDCIGREYFTVGEATSLAHFNESLGIWSSEEIIDPEMIRVSKSIFVEEERVQLLVKDMIERLRTGPQGMPESEESPSERMERVYQYCCTPETKVLTAAMEWVPVRQLRLGDKIVGFDEFAPGGKGNGRSFRETEVTATSVIHAPVFDVATDGPRVTCTGAHMWLAQHKTYDYTWIRTDQLEPGDKIRYLGEWDHEDNADVGYVSGIFDGEGHFSSGTLAFSQRPGPVLDKTIEILERYKFKLRITEPTTGCKTVRILGGIHEIARALGIFRPIRLVPKFYKWLDGKAMAGSSFKPVVVQSITPAGTADVVALATSTKTLMAAGMFSHNTQLVKNYPEFVRAADQDDGLDISDALVSRLVHRASPWDLRGTPHLMRSFRTLMMEESLNAAQDAVADRLYAPMILATLGMDNLGDGEPWIPSQADLDQVRDDMQSALAADFKLMVHNMGLKVESVFGRESVPRFDQDYDRITAKLLQAWGIGEALVAGGSGGAYASSALNREVCEQLMLQFQNKVKRHIIKRMEVIAEAQEHYDYEQKGGYRRPLYREIVQYNEETGEEEIVRVPKLLIPEVNFATLNLRDEATERAFVQQLKAAGVPVSDKMLAINLPIDFKRELERSAEETVQKGLATAQAMDKLQKLCDTQGIPYPPELAQQLSATLELRQGLAQTEMIEGQTEMQEVQMKQMGMAGQMGLLPGVPPVQQQPQADVGSEAEGGEGGGQPGVPFGTPPAQTAPGTTGTPMNQLPAPVEIPRNRQRPEESDEMRAGAPRAANIKSRLEIGPSSYGRSRYAKREQIDKAVRRLEAIQKHQAGKRVEDLVDDPDFYDALHAQQYEDQIRADFPEILNGGAPQSKRILEDLLDQYAEIFGSYPEW